MRLKDKVAVIIGAGQSPGETLGNGRATVLRFAQEGARIFAVDRDLDSADETAALARAEGGDVKPHAPTWCMNPSSKPSSKPRMSASVVSTSCITMSASRWPVATRR
jgi:NAD(P)-dependent dehydrogenase (short-subunit alcohol dehydrogenase family)